MNTYTKLFLKVIVFISLIYGLTTNVTAQSKFLPKVQDHTSIAQISSSNAEGTGVSFINPYTNVRDTYFAGLFLGTLNSVSTKFYCIDINTHLARNEDYWDEGSTPSEITYILNNYFPFKTSYAGILSNLNKEAAAIQFAIWHFSDNTDINSISGADDIKNRANVIVADANANHNNVVPLQSLLILPSSQSLAQGTNATFDIYALDLNGNPISGLAVTISSSIGALSATSGTTNASGHVGPITLTYSGTGTATINVKANVAIPQGTRYVYKAGSNLKQKLVLATPAFDMKEETATVKWYTKPSQCDLNGFTTFTQGGWGSPSNSTPGKIRDLYFSTIFPSGLTVGGNFTIKLTSATAVKNYLPDGTTPAVLTQNYIDPTTSINVLAGQLTALKLNIYFDAAGKIGTNSTDLGALIIATGPFTGMTVNAFLSLAEQALGGGSLSGFTLSQYNDAATAINENFDNGTVDNGFLSCEEQVCENTVGSYVYRDLNVNGTKDSGEPGIAGAVVELVQGTTVLATATTDANGHYSFPNLVNGTYTVRLASSNFASGGVFFNTAQVKWYTKNSTSVSTILNCNDNLSINFGYYKTCIGITKTADKITYKPGDIITYTITVENCGDILLSGGVDVFDTMLWGTTAYHINIIDPGQTFVIPVANTKYTVKAADCGNLKNTIRAEGHPVDGSATVTAETSVTVTVDCTVCENTVGSYVYRDLNVNGTKDSGEPGIAGAVVELVQGTTVLATAITDVNGHYSFPNLVNGVYTVRLASSNFASGGVFFNTAQVKWYTKNSTSVNTTLNCNDNLFINFGYYKTCVSITKSSDKQSYNKGETITYSFLIENCGDIQLHGGIDIFDPMLKSTGDHLIKHIDILDPGQSTTFTFNYVAGDNDCGQLINTARAEGHPVDGSATVVDESSWTVAIICEQKADIKIEKTVDNPNPKCDDNVNFTIKVTNLGPNTSSGIVATDLLPSGLNYVSNTASQGSYNSTTGIWNVGTLASGSFATLTIKVKVDCGQLNNSAFDLGTAKDYNLFVIEDANQPSSDTQGKVAVGRDATFANYSISDQLLAGSGDVLIVGRDLNYASGAIYNGNVVYGHSTNLPQSSVSITGGTLRKDNPIDFTAEKSYLQSLSTTLSGYAVNGTTAFQYGGLTLTGTDPFLNVFTLSGASLSSANNITIDVPNGSVVLVNISGTTLSWTGGLTVNGTAITNVLYNFYQATAITISGIDIKGSALAPFAAVNFISGVINGQMICYSLTGSGQFNYAMFGGHIPYDKKITNVATITSCSTPDPNSNNNTSSATIAITNTTGDNNNGNGTWTNVCSFGPGEMIYTLAYYGNDIYAGTWGGKIYKSTDGGKNWIVINTGMNVSFIWSLNVTGGVIFAATEKGVYKFNGSAWILTSLSGKDIHALVSYNGTLYAGTWGFGIFKSTDLGSTWIPFNDGLGVFLTIQSLTITSNGNIFAGTAGGGIFKCTDGTKWNKIACAYNMIWSLASTSTTIFAGTYGDGLYKSTDGGMTFTKVTSLNVTFVYSMSVDLSGKIYVSSLTNGVYMSSDNGSTWTSLGMSGYGVSAMVVNPSSDDVYVGTKEGQVYKISGNNNVTGVGDNFTTPTEYKLAQNYPNPFNPSTTIEFVVPQAGMYSLKVYNTLGQEVVSLVESELASGLHKVTFDASKFASGMYIYKLSGNNVNISKKMILMK